MPKRRQLELVAGGAADRDGLGRRDRPSPPAEPALVEIVRLLARQAVDELERARQGPGPAE